MKLVKNTATRCSMLAVALAFAPAATAAEGAFEFGLYGGYTAMDNLEVLGSTWNVTPRVGYMIEPTLALELDIGFMSGNTSLGDPDPYPYTAFAPRVGLYGILFEDVGFHPTVSLGVGAMAKTVNDNGNLGLPVEGMDVDFLGNAGPGVLIPIAGPVHFRSDVRWLLNLGGENFENRGDAFLDWEWTAGVMFKFGGPADADKDGIVDDDDTCPDQAEDFDQFEDEDGCPEADNDDDGVVDESDSCPNDAEDLDEFEDEDGCPEADNDEDGVVDADDKCPVDAGPEATKGCPDTDGDGIADLRDECESEAGGKDSFGCPDGDGDRVPDYRDECPEEKAPTAVNPKRSNGCVGRAYVAKGKIVINEKVQFDTGKATLKSASNDLLNDVAGLLTKYAGIEEMQVEGHTDSQGDDAANQKLSEERAAAVVAYLVEQGVEAERLKAKGFGETKPVEDNETSEGRAANRRVEFNILKEDVSREAKRKRKSKEKEAAKENKEAAEDKAE